MSKRKAFYTTAHTKDVKPDCDWVSVDDFLLLKREQDKVISDLEAQLAECQRENTFQGGCTNEFVNWHTTEIEDRLFHLEPVDIAEIAFNAGRESICSQREAYQRGYRAGRKLQREKDAAIADALEYPSMRRVAKAIREQEIPGD